MNICVEVGERRGILALSRTTNYSIFVLERSQTKAPTASQLHVDRLGIRFQAYNCPATKQISP